ncbi:unnamed protein product [Amoebophrya sp. A120]|nr:unnamed protein product [Amoebophrya sp. A120]|eukprot:GSA120T00002539001.1
MTTIRTRCSLLATAARATRLVALFIELDRHGVGVAATAAGMQPWWKHAPLYSSYDALATRFTLTYLFELTAGPNQCSSDKKFWASEVEPLLEDGLIEYVKAELHQKYHDFSAFSTTAPLAELKYRPSFSDLAKGTIFPSGVRFQLRSREASCGGNGVNNAGNGQGYFRHLLLSIQ